MPEDALVISDDSNVDFKRYSTCYELARIREQNIAAQEEMHTVTNGGTTCQAL